MPSKRYSRTESGFATIKVALVIIAVAAIAGGGFFIERSHKKSATPIQKTSNSQSARTSKPVNACLTLSDLQTYAYSPITKVEQDTPIARVYFKPDVTDYNPTLMPANKPVGTSAYQLYQNTSAKDYQFTITASTSEESTSESGQTLAAARAEKVKDELIARGIPAAKISVLPPTHGLAGGDLTRYAYIGVRVPASCTK